MSFANADFTVMGRTNAETCSTYAFGLNFSHIFSDNSANVGGSVGGIFGSILGGPSGEESRAIYAALEKMPEASHLISPKINSVESGLAPFGLMLFGSKCATVDARGVLIGEKPIPPPTYHMNGTAPTRPASPPAPPSPTP